MQKILVIEDERAIAENIANYLKRVEESYTVVTASDGIDGFSRAASDESIDLVVLDIGLPGIDGLDVCKRLRGLGWTKPIVMLTALDTIPDRVKGLESGADDYLVKPFSLEELHARIRVQLRRRQTEEKSTVLRVADLKLDLRLWQVTKGDTPLRLSANAMKVLAVLMKKSPSVVTHEELSREVWNNRIPSPETIRSHVYMVRNAVDGKSDKPLIKTIQGIGWALRED